MNKIKASIPNTITCCNLTAGCVAIIMSFNGPSTMACGLTGWQMTWIMIGLATVFDFADGLSARLLHAYSHLGKELDSLADLVSFGLAPGMLMFNLLNHLAAPSWACYLALFIPVMGALRLAKFNVDDRQSVNFMGLPIPSNAILWIGYSAWLLANPMPAGDLLPAATDGGIILPATLWLTVALLVAVPLLMVSDVRMFSLKYKSRQGAINRLRVAMLVIAVVLLATFGVQGLAAAIFIYFALSLAGRRHIG